ncbi:MAG: hypothetical protein ACK5QX_11275 [bacterium]|jgi:hypothetical protein
MANQTITYRNQSLGRDVQIVYNDQTGQIVSHTVLLTSSAAVVTGILAEIRPFPTVVIGYLVVQNTAPYASFFSIGSGCAGLSISTTTSNASVENTADGSVVINVSGFDPVWQLIDYSINGVNYQNSNSFAGLAPGVYEVLVRVSDWTVFGYQPSCSELVQFTIGFNSVVCDLAIGAVTTVPANGSNGQINVLTLINVRATVEYRLGAGAWQDSPTFTGLSANTYNLQVRYKNYTSCVVNRNIVVGNSVSCNLAIAAVNVVHEQSSFADNGSINILATSSNLPISYSIDNGTTFQASPIFTGLAPGQYIVKAIDNIGCEETRVVEVLRYKKRFVEFPIVNSLRFVLENTDLQNFDNVLFANQQYAGVMQCDYKQAFELSDTTVIQFRSSFSNNQIKIFNAVNDNLVGTILPFKRLSYIDKSDTRSAFFANLGGGQVQIFFNNGLPLIYQIGQTITVTNQASLNGTYDIVDIRQGFGAAAGYEVLVINKVWTSPSAILSGDLTTIFNLEDFDVYEFTINWSVYGVGEFYIEVVGTDLQFPSYKALSEPVSVKAKQDEHVLIEYKNFDTAFKVDYSTGIIHKIRVYGELKWPLPGGENTTYRDSNARLIKVEELVTRNPQLFVYDLPPYLLEKIRLAMAHDWFKINGVEYQSEEGFEPEYFQNDGLGNGKAKIQQVEFMSENSHDSGQADIDVLGTNESLLGVP